MPYVGAWVGRRSPELDAGRLRHRDEPGLLAERPRGRRERRHAVLRVAVLALDGGVSLGMGKFGNVKIDHQNQVMPEMNNSDHDEAAVRG